LTPDPRNLIRNDITILGAAVVRRPVIHGDPGSGTRAEPEPLAGIRAAAALRHAASRAAADCTRYAREDGKTWAEIGEAMGTGPDPDAAFLAVASRLGRGPSFAWTCGSCGQTVLDYGPEAGLHDSEQGHGDGCERFAAMIEAWDAAWKEADGE
jgi:hypothetical protein